MLSRDGSNLKQQGLSHSELSSQVAGANVTKEQSRRIDGAFLAVGALNDILRSTVSSFPRDHTSTSKICTPWQIQRCGAAA